MHVSSALFDLESELLFRSGLRHAGRAPEKPQQLVQVFWLWEQTLQTTCILSTFFKLNVPPFLSFQLSTQAEKTRGCDHLKLWLIKIKKTVWPLLERVSCRASGKWIIQSDKGGNYTWRSIFSHWSIWQLVKLRCT